MFTESTGHRHACRKLVVSGVILVLVALLGVSCSDDDPVRTRTPPATKNYQNLTQRDHVLNNLELCYNEQNISEYTRLLDDPNFTFYFSAGDIGGGIPDRWDRSEDIARQGKMFDPNYNGAYRVISIELTLDFAPGDGEWTDTIPDQNDFPGETWYNKEATYELKFVAESRPENITFLAQGLRARFTVRQSDFEGAQKWRIVEWRDDV